MDDSAKGFVERLNIAHYIGCERRSPETMLCFVKRTS